MIKKNIILFTEAGHTSVSSRSEPHVHITHEKIQQKNDMVSGSLHRLHEIIARVEKAAALKHQKPNPKP